MAEKVKCEICNESFKDIDGLEKHRNTKHSLSSNKEEHKQDGKANNHESQNNKYLIYGIIGVLVISAVIYIVFSSSGSSQYDSFAQCLTEKGAVMYGAFWCSHCAEQKQLFGSSFKKVKYVECSTPDGKSQTGACNNEGIQSYPTWKFSDGSVQEGVLSIQELGARTGCSINTLQ